MIHVFHGFLGSPEDLSYLQLHEDVILHDLLQFDEKKLTLSENDTLIGYSMGGRVALGLAKKFNFHIKQLVLLSSHPGLETQKEKDERFIWENDILKKMDSPHFFEYWNSLPIFQHDQPIQNLSEERFKKYQLLFDKFRLSNQENFLPLIDKNKNKIIYLAGLNDEKYKRLTTEKLIPLGLRCHMIHGGHRLFQHQESVMNVLRFEGIL